MVLFFGIVISIHADELDDITKQLASLTADLNSKESDKSNIAKQISGIRSRVGFISAEVAKKEREVAEGEKDLEHQKTLLDERARSYYKNIKKSGSAFIGLLIGENFSDSLQNFFYQKVVVDEDRNAIVKIVLYIKNLEDTKQKLVDEKRQLAAINKQLDSQSSLLEGEIASTRSKIAQLSAQQQSLVAAKLSALNIPRSAGTSARGCSDDRSVDPGFSPAVAFFSFGAPHRVGLNQYGAKGRAEAGQSYDTILRAYFNFDEIKDVSGVRIRVEGGSEYDLEDYMKGIREMPESWPQEALKAQAVAARSYALAYTNNGSGSICSTESCQVFSDPGGRNDGWTQAVEATRGKVAAQGGSPIKAWFASTHGGYVFSSAEVWGGSTSFTKHTTDTTTGSAGGFSDLQSNAYDKSSPWFYCDWGARGSYSNTAWLKPSEVADIFNVIELVRRDSGTKDHLYQPDKPHPYGGEVWSPEKVRQELQNKGGSPVESVTSISISADFGFGRTNSVSGGGISASGDEFKSWFNLRAPANIQIVGPLFNVETR